MDLRELRHEITVIQLPCNVERLDLLLYFYDLNISLDYVLICFENFKT